MFLPTQMRSSFRNKNTPKKTGFQVQQERIHDFIDTIRVATLKNKEISDYDLQLSLQWGPGVYERIARIVKHGYSDQVLWNKKRSVWAYIQLEEKIEIKPID